MGVIKRERFRSGKRDRMEIVSAIIAIAQRPTRLTRIMGRANLSYSVLKDYLAFLIGRHLVEKCDAEEMTEIRSPFYQATEKGNMFLELYCEQLILIHGERFLDGKSDLAEAYITQYFRKNRRALVQNYRKRVAATEPFEKTLSPL